MPKIPGLQAAGKDPPTHSASWRAAASPCGLALPETPVLEASSCYQEPPWKIRLPTQMFLPQRSSVCTWCFPSFLPFQELLLAPGRPYGRRIPLVKGRERVGRLRRKLAPSSSGILISSERDPRLGRPQESPPWSIPTPEGGLLCTLSRLRLARRGMC